MSVLSGKKRQQLRHSRDEDNQHTDRWVVSYADFVTLLFAFFVVMYSVSSVNEGKYREISGALVSAFQKEDNSVQTLLLNAGMVSGSAAPTMITLPVPGDYPEQERYSTGTRGLFEDGADQPSSDEARQAGASADGGTGSGQPARLANPLSDALQALIDRGDASIVNRGEWLEISIQSGILFASGSADLASAAKAYLMPTAKLLAEDSNLVEVEGYTDNLPINTVQYPTNWELSSARAAAVVRWLIERGVAPARLSATGFGEFRPTADNATEQGRRQNRRIAILVRRADVGHAQDSVQSSPAAKSAGLPAHENVALRELLDFKVGTTQTQAAQREASARMMDIPVRVVPLEQLVTPAGKVPAKRI